MKRIIALTLVFTLAFSVNTFAAKYSPETQRLMEEAGLGEDNSVEEIMRRQEEYKRNKANNSTPNTVTGQNGANRTLKSSNDEFKVIPGGGGVKVTNTPDELHIYNNDYGTGNYGSVFSNDELHTAPVEIQPNDGYKHGSFDELHIPEVYRNQVWHPDHKINRITIDEFKTPDEM